jgi:transcriptional regulator with XRE-family HTH domain
LRTYRKRSGLSQEEIAFLIDASSGTTVSRHEDLHRVPSLANAFGYEAIFGIPPSALFPGEYEKMRAQIESRAITLLGKLTREGKEDTLTVYKRKYLEGLLRRVRK